MSITADFGVAVGNLNLHMAFDVAGGETLALLGPNGTGKTSTLRAVAGLLPVESGSISIDGVPVDDPAAAIFVPPERRRVGYVFQDYGLFDHLDVVDNVAFGARAGGASRRAGRGEAMDWLERLGVTDLAGYRPRQLSGGQAQRVALARALAAKPDVLVLDEPLAALDVEARSAVRRSLSDHLAGFHGARILVTHDPIDAYVLADRVAVIEGGRIAQTGPIADVVAHPRSQFVADLVGANLVAGEIANGRFTADGIGFDTATDFTGPAWAMIRTQSIVIAESEPSGSARISLSVTVEDVTALGGRARVQLGGAVSLTAEVTTSAVAELSLAPGTSCYAHIKATDVAVYPA